jgi:hypothetical protein
MMDAAGQFQMPCSDCAIVDAAPDARRTDSADTFRNDAYGIHSRCLNDDPPNLRSDVIGVRRARDP